METFIHTLSSDKSLVSSLQFGELSSLLSSLWWSPNCLPSAHKNKKPFTSSSKADQRVIQLCYRLSSSKQKERTMNKDLRMIAILTRNPLSWKWSKKNMKRLEVPIRKLLTKVKNGTILTSIWIKIKIMYIFSMLSNNMLFREKLNIMPFKVRWWEAWAWALRTR